jgi:hypothetical protein
MEATVEEEAVEVVEVEPMVSEEMVAHLGLLLVVQVGHFQFLEVLCFTQEAVEAVAKAEAHPQVALVSEETVTGTLVALALLGQLIEVEVVAEAEEATVRVHLVAQVSSSFLIQPTNF